MPAISRASRNLRRAVLSRQENPYRRIGWSPEKLSSTSPFSRKHRERPPETGLHHERRRLRYQAGPGHLDPLSELHDIEETAYPLPRPRHDRQRPLEDAQSRKGITPPSRATLHPELIEAMASSRDLIRKTAPERIKYELDLIMISQGVHREMEILTNGADLRDRSSLRRCASWTWRRLLTRDLQSIPFWDSPSSMTAAAITAANRAAAKDVGYALLFHDLRRPTPIPMTAESRVSSISSITSAGLRRWPRRSWSGCASAPMR